MPQGSKAKYTTKQKRKARHIEEGYEDRGIRPKEAARRAWATVNKESGGGKKSGSGRGKPEKQVGLAQGRTPWWPCRRASSGIGPLGLRPQGGSHAQAARVALTPSPKNK